MTDQEKQAYYLKQRNTYYWLAYGIGYVFPFLYFLISMGITEEVTRVVMPTLFLGFVAIGKLAKDIPAWTQTWKPSLKKGLVMAVPKVLLFIVLVTLGLTLKYMVTRAIDVAFFTYFETVFVFFGGQALGAIFAAFHRMYKEKYLISIGYVLGTVNK